MIGCIMAAQALERLSSTIAIGIEEVRQVSIKVHTCGDRDREAFLVEVGQDIIALVGSMQVFKRRGARDRETVGAS